VRAREARGCVARDRLGTQSLSLYSMQGGMSTCRNGLGGDRCGGCGGMWDFWKPRPGQVLRGKFFRKQILIKYENMNVL